MSVVGRLIFQVFKGHDLTNMDVMDKMDPYCILSIGKQKTQTEVVTKGGCHPVWPKSDGLVELEWAGERDLLVTVMDKDTFTADDFVGQCQLRLHALAKLERFEGDLVVYRDHTRAAGTLTVRISLDGQVLEDHDGCQGHIQMAPGKRHGNHIAANIITLDDPLADLSVFFTYEVALQSVANIFGDAMNEQCGLKGAARIFGEGPKCALVRKSVEIHHSLLYRDGARPDCCRTRGARTECYMVSDGKCFMQMIGFGRRDLLRRVFTFVVVDSGLFFSEAGARMPKDVCSKHAVHAAGSSRVRFAGTFRVCEDNAARSILVVDDDSGTYRPKVEHLALLQELLEMNFPGLHVRALSIHARQPENTLDFLGPCEAAGHEESVYKAGWGGWRWKSE